MAGGGFAGVTAANPSLPGGVSAVAVALPIVPAFDYIMVLDQAALLEQLSALQIEARPQQHGPVTTCEAHVSAIVFLFSTSPLATHGAAFVACCLRC